MASTGMGGGAPGAALLVQAAQQEAMNATEKQSLLVMYLNREGRRITRAPQR
jgi:hypothetical protein